MTNTVQQAQEAAALMSQSGGSCKSTAKRWSSSRANIGRPGQQSKRWALERQMVTDAHVELQRSQADLRGALGQAAGIKRELDQAAPPGLVAGERSRGHQQDRGTGVGNTAVVDRPVEDIESKIASLGTLHELAATTEERLTSLNALAEHVTVKTKALETQRKTIDHAAAEASRLNEMVWAMEAQIGKLEEGNRQVTRAKEVLRQAEEFAEEVQDELDAATVRRDQFRRETARVEKDGAQLIQTVRAQIERLAIEGKSFDAHEQRIADLQGALDTAERQFEVVLGGQEAAGGLETEGGDAWTDRAADLGGARRAVTAARRGRLTGGTPRGRGRGRPRGGGRQAGLESGRQRLEGLRAELEAIHASHASATELCTRLNADRMALETASENIARFADKAPAIANQLEAVLEKLRLVDDADRIATRTRETVIELEAALARSTEKLQFVEKAERRLNGLHTLNTEVGRRMEEQLMRRAELEGIRTRTDEISAQISDAHQKLGAIRTAQESCRRFWNAPPPSAATSSSSRRA